VEAPTEDTRELLRDVARLQAGVLAFVGALLGGGAVWGMTAWLLVKGGPNVGAHLQLLGQYFHGYTVTWAGSFVGMFYGALVGAAVGWVIGAVYNLVAGLRQ
jgi:hypothetical protein